MSQTLMDVSHESLAASIPITIEGLPSMSMCGQNDFRNKFVKITFK